MTKAELIQALSTFPDDATIMVAHPNQDGTATLDDVASVCENGGVQINTLSFQDVLDKEDAQ